MALTEVEFELSAGQFDLMGYPHLRQGQPLVLQLETGVLLPDPAAEAWYAVAKEPMPERFVRVGRAQYAFAGQIEAAETMQHDDVETATLIVRCGEIPLRVYCAPQEDGRLPYGTWETRYLAGYSRIYGLAEEDLSMGPGSQIGDVLELSAACLGCPATRCSASGTSRWNCCRFRMRMTGSV